MNWAISTIIFMVALPFALKINVNHLKYYARVLFSFSIVVFILVFIGAFVNDKQVDPKDAAMGFCVENLYILKEVKSSSVNLYAIATLT